MHRDLFSAIVVKHEDQRYPTTGDWRMTKRGDIEVRVSNLSDPRYEFLIAIHETIEAKLCHEAGITEDAVNKFDIAYEDARTARLASPCGCVPTDKSEPGDDIHAPYHKQHTIATMIEAQLARELGVDWALYEQANLDLYKEHGQV